MNGTSVQQMRKEALEAARDPNVTVFVDIEMDDIIYHVSLDKLTAPMALYMNNFIGYTVEPKTNCMGWTIPSSE